MSVAIGNIEKVCNQTYAAGMKLKAYIACFCAVLSIPPKGDNHTVTDDIVMSPAVVASPGPPAVAAQDAGTFSSWDISSKDQIFRSVQDPESKLWLTEFQFFIPGVTGVKSAILNAIGSETSILILPDLNSQNRIVGDVDNPADFTYESQTTTKNGYLVKGTWSSGEEPLFYTGAFALT